ncbi:MAG: hypothetical protein P4N60_11170 [Verrucomicrobiae bacterium]|nr:hypothetical protein [Verrucomicrobiae bacterium]
MSLRADVDRGLVIRAEIEKLAVELKEIEARLKEAGLHGEQIELTDADREGRQFLATGSEQIVPVIFTADIIMGEFPNDSAKHKRILKLVNAPVLSNFYKPVSKHENRFDNGKKFRALAEELLGKEAPAFITACLARDKEGTPKNAVKVMWDGAKAKSN